VRDTLHEIKSFGVDAFEVRADISTTDGVQDVMTAVQRAFGRLNILVNSASVFPQGAFLEATLAEWEQTMAVNLRAPFLFSQAAARLMLANTPPGGAIVNIVDQGVDRPWLKRPIHGISKAALWSLTQTSALALAPHIRVNAVLPGPVMKTNDGMSDATWQAMGQALPLKTTGEGADVARAVVYLARETFITGALLHVNGGEHLA
jgi:pteridine reductase